jgi:UDP-N-acetylglucosamine 4-epimerase
MTAYDKVKSELRASPKRWLVTGVAGFIGSNLLETLLKLDQMVVGLDDISTGRISNLQEVLALVSSAQRRRFKFVKGDIRRLETCRRVCSRIDFVLHQAALGSVPRSVEEPIRFHESNVSGFLNMLVAARDAKVKRFVYASSSSVYGDNPDLPKIENKTGDPLSPYAATKAISELYAKVFARTYNLASIGLRYFNVFGPRQDPDSTYAAVIPKWAAAVINREPIYINGDGETSRDFCYVANVVQANLLAATTRNFDALNRVLNVAIGESTTLNQLLALIRSVLNDNAAASTENKVIHRDFRAGDIRHSLADIEQARQFLDYTPEYRIQEGITLALHWYKNNTSCKLAKSVNLKRSFN